MTSKPINRCPITIAREDYESAIIHKNIAEDTIESFLRNQSASKILYGARITKDTHKSFLQNISVYTIPGKILNKDVKIKIQKVTPSALSKECFVTISIAQIESTLEWNIRGICEIQETTSDYNIFEVTLDSPHNKENREKYILSTPESEIFFQEEMPTYDEFCWSLETIISSVKNENILKNREKFKNIYTTFIQITLESQAAIQIQNPDGSLKTIGHSVKTSSENQNVCVMICNLEKMVEHLGLYEEIEKDTDNNPKEFSCNNLFISKEIENIKNQIEWENTEWKKTVYNNKCESKHDILDILTPEDNDFFIICQKNTSEIL